MEMKSESNMMEQNEGTMIFTKKMKLKTENEMLKTIRKMITKTKKMESKSESNMMEQNEGK